MSKYTKLANNLMKANLWLGQDIRGLVAKLWITYVSEGAS